MFVVLKVKHDLLTIVYTSRSEKYFWRWITEFWNRSYNRLQSGLREYAEYIIERNKVADYMQVVDPRTEEEKINASDLQEIGLQQATDKNYASGKCCDLLVASWQYSRYCGIVRK